MNAPCAVHQIVRCTICTPMSCTGRGHSLYRASDEQGRWFWLCWRCPHRGVAAPPRGTFPPGAIVTNVVPHDGPCEASPWSGSGCSVITAWGYTRANHEFRSFRCGESVWPSTSSTPRCDTCGRETKVNCHCCGRCAEAANTPVEPWHGKAGS